MRVIVKNKPETGAITLEEAKEHLEADSSYEGNDSNIESKILTATLMMDKLTGKRTITQTIEMQFDSWKELELHEVMQGKINSFDNLLYLDEDNVLQEVSTSDFESIGKDTEFGRIIFNDSFDYPEIWDIESIFLTLNVGYDKPDVPEEYRTMVKMLISEMIDGEDISIFKEHFAYNFKYWNF